MKAPSGPELDPMVVKIVEQICQATVRREGSLGIPLLAPLEELWSWDITRGACSRPPVQLPGRVKHLPKALEFWGVFLVMHIFRKKYMAERDGRKETHTVLTMEQWIESINSCDNLHNQRG